MFIDTHTHLNFKAFKDDWEEIVGQAVGAGVEKMIVVGTDTPSSLKAVELADQNDSVYASVGIHPHHAREFLIPALPAGRSNSKFLINNQLLNSQTKKLEKLARYKNVVAIGEVGLDYHVYQNSKYSRESRPGVGIRDKQIADIKIDKKLKNLQKQLLGMQVNVAKEVGKPLIIHSREAGDEVLDVIEHFSKSDGTLPSGVFHCFDGSKQYLKKIIEAGFYVGFTGNVTYVDGRAEVANRVPMERLLLETDCPYMKPSQGPPSFLKTPGLRRGKSEPRDVKIIAEFHAKQRGISVKTIEKQTTENAKRLFGI